LFGISRQLFSYSTPPGWGTVKRELVESGLIEWPPLKGHDCGIGHGSSSPSHNPRRR
jgi:hypothetical protein